MHNLLAIGAAQMALVSDALPNAPLSTKGLGFLPDISSMLAAFTPLDVFGAIWPYVMMLLGFSLIIFVHELGHFAVAKWAGVRVDRFAIGFGRELFGFTRGETRYSFNILPLGGYVKMLGQEDFDDKSNELRFKDDPSSFTNKPVGHRMAIVSAGVIMNVLFAGLLFMIVFLMGMEVIGPRIAYVMPDSPAERAGLQPGDVVRKINGENILEFNEILFAVLLAPPHQEIEFTVERNGEQRAVLVEPEYRRPDRPGDVRRQMIGISPGITPEIVAVGPEIDAADPRHPRVGDRLHEVDGIEVTNENASEIREMLGTPGRRIVVERPDSKSHAAPGESSKSSSSMVEVEIPPVLSIYPADPRDPSSVSILGLSPLVRVGMVDPKGRAFQAGIEVGDTVLMWDDKPLPTQFDIVLSIRDSAERDIPFRVRKRSGREHAGFMRPKVNPRGGGTMQALCRDDETSIHQSSGGSESEETTARITWVRPYGAAATAGIRPGDVIVNMYGNENPTCSVVDRIVRANPGSSLSVTVRKPDGRDVKTYVVPQPPGSLDAGFSLVAEDMLVTGDILETIHDRPTPAALAEIPAGALITQVNGTPVDGWIGLINQFRHHAGKTIRLTYEHHGVAEETDFPVPHSIRTLLGVGPEASIVRIDGKEWVTVTTVESEDKLSVRYHEGTRQMLTRLAGQKRVPVEFRATPLSELTTTYIDVTEDMVDPWLGRIAYTPNVVLAEELVLLKGENALDAVWIGIHKTYYFIKQVYLIMERMFFTRSVGLETVSGPLGIIDMGGKVARAGLVQFLFFMAMISANLAVINFLPLPIVDGGHMVFLIIEKIKGTPVSLRVQVATQMIGLVLIIGVFLFVTYQDFVRLFS
jgi:membrane-associated protease RseP (regulator of RpoE activity)